jgi:hypothetical protein
MCLFDGFTRRRDKLACGTDLLYAGGSRPISMPTVRTCRLRGAVSRLYTRIRRRVCGQLRNGCLHFSSIYLVSPLGHYPWIWKPTYSRAPKQRTSSTATHPAPAPPWTLECGNRAYYPRYGFTWRTSTLGVSCHYNFGPCLYSSFNFAESLDIDRNRSSSSADRSTDMVTSAGSFCPNLNFYCRSALTSQRVARLISMPL